MAVVGTISESGTCVIVTEAGGASTSTGADEDKVSTAPVIETGPGRSPWTIPASLMVAMVGSEEVHLMAGVSGCP